MHFRFTSKLIAAFAVSAIIYSCDKKGGTEIGTDGDADKDRKAVLVNIADNIVKPSYAVFAAKLDDMIAKSDAFKASPNKITLAEFRAAWADTYIAWQKVELFDFGPASRNGIRNYINIYPTSPSGINTFINNPSQNLEVIGTYDKQGFPALDYLINGVGVNDDAIVAYYTEPAEGAKRLAYIVRINEHIKQLTDQVISEWNGAYYTSFTTRTGVDIGSPMGEMVNGYVLHFERFIRSGKIGIPSGAMLNGVAAPDKVEGFYKKDISKVLAQTALQAVADFFNGKSAKTGVEGASFKIYLDALDAKDSATGTKLTDIINAQLGVCNTKVGALGANFAEQIATNNEAMKEAYTSLQAVVRMLKVDMTSAMSITITYTDNDGD